MSHILIVFYKNKLLASMVVNALIPITQEEEAGRSYEFEDNLVYIVRSRLVKATKQKLCLKKKLLLTWLIPIYSVTK